MKTYIVKLTDEERKDLEQMISTGKDSARKLQHARILLKADESESGPSWKDEQISEALEVCFLTIYRVRGRFVEEGLDAELWRRKGCGIGDWRLVGDCGGL